MSSSSEWETMHQLLCDSVLSWMQYKEHFYSFRVYPNSSKCAAVSYVSYNVFCLCVVLETSIAATTTRSFANMMDSEKCEM